ncbi:MAG: nucleotide exchange factor GrpE [Candidatus Saccharimonadales bacterium]|nr:nucleotide exchange factor GrpE [Candidatus Saccharimonadales bacterium]
MPKATKKPKKDTAKAQIAELTDDLKRVSADFANYKRRTEEERVTLARFTKQQLIADLLPVLDNVERALSHVPKELAKNEWAQGVAKVASQLTDKLNSIGVKKIPSIGEEFDPHLHEAIAVEGQGKKEIISDEIQTGYLLNDEVIRHSIVKVKRK